MDRKTWIIVPLCVIALIGHYYWMAKQQQAAREVAAEEAAAAAAAGIVAPADGVEGVDGTVTEVGGDGTPVASSAEAVAAAAALAQAQAGAPEEKLIVTREGIAFNFSSYGGISDVTLLEHYAGGAKPEEGEDFENVVLNREAAMPIAAIGFGKDVPAALSHTLTQNGDSVVMSAVLPGGLEVTKTFTVQDDGDGDAQDRHLVGCSIRFTNRGESPVDLSNYTMYSGSALPMVGQTAADLPPSFVWDSEGDAERKGARWFDGRRILGMQLSDPRSELAVVAPELRWAGVSNKFFASVFIPEVKTAAAEAWATRFETAASKAGETKNTEYGVHGGIGFPEIPLPVGQEVSLEYDLYVGPKEYGRVSKISKDFRGVMFYGFFTPISKFLMWVMSKFYGVVGNWGWAIVCMTLFIRVCIWPLHAKSTRAMKRMSLLAPKMTEIREKYADDPQRMNTEMMGLYKKYKVNPVAGCFPIFLQMPIFFGFFQLLRSTAELRGADWGWANDLSMPDTIAHIGGLPLNPLPILMGVSMFFQMSLAPKSGDKTQQMVFKFMPLIFLVICYNFASALALYWTVSNVFSIGQTWLMKFQPDPVLDEAKGGGSSGKKGGGDGGDGGGGDDDGPKKISGRPSTGGGKTKSRGGKK